MNTKTFILTMTSALMISVLLTSMTNDSDSSNYGIGTARAATRSGSSSLSSGGAEYLAAETRSGTGAAPVQDTGSGFVITLKNGSSVRGRTLTRDQASGTLRLTMTQDASGQPKSYAMIAMDDADSIRASSSDADSIQVKIRGGSIIRCKEFSLSPDTITLKIGTRSTISVPWDQIESISFAQ